MRILIACLTACVALSVSSAALAQDESPFAYDATVTKTKKTPRLSRLNIKRETAAQLLHFRAVESARQRRARMQLRNWKGISLMRPNMKTIVPLEGTYIPGGWGWGWDYRASNLQMRW